jgi:hypothetical protein
MSNSSDTDPIEKGSSMDDMETQSESSRSKPRSRRPSRPMVDHGATRKVNSRSSITEMRESDALSDGASSALVRRLSASYTHTRLSVSIQSRPTYITSLIEDMQWAFQELECNFEKAKLEEWAIFVHASLTNESRNYHGVPHVFEISAGAAPMQLLAAIFRDVTNHYIDGEGISEKHVELLQGVLQEGTYILQSDLSSSSPSCPASSSGRRLALVSAIFGVTPGTDMSMYQGMHKGLDVFLSAVAASRLLEDTLSLKQTAQLCSCLEATIPFRTAPGGESSSPDSVGPLDRLFGRLEQANQDFDLHMTPQEMVETVQLGADLTNRNIGNMVADDLTEFLSHTWSLLPEQNVALRQHSLFTVHDFYDAVHNMVHWVQNIEAECIYSTFRGVPDEEERMELHEQLTYNLHLAVIYLQARLLSVGVVAAFAALTGGDAPFSFFFGDAPSVNGESAQLGDGLVGLSASASSLALVYSFPEQESGQESPAESLSDDNEVEGIVSQEVLNLLRGHRMIGTFFDKGNAPLAAFLYENLGDDLVSAGLELCSLDFTEESARALLQFLPARVFRSVAKELSRFTVSRTKAIAALQEEILAAPHKDTPPSLYGEYKEVSA